MSPQKSMHFLREFLPDSFSRGDLFDTRFAQTIDRAKFSQQQVFSILTHARTIVQNAFVDSLLEQQLMISVRKPVRFIADSLKQVKRAGIHGQLKRHGPSRPIDFLMFFGQTDDWQIMKAKPLQLATRRRKLALAAVDDDQVRQTNGNKLRVPDIGYRIGFNPARSVESILLRMLR